jgi:hypothetical protein
MEEKQRIKNPIETISGEFYGILFEVTFNDYERFTFFLNKNEDFLKKLKEKCFKKKNVDSTYEVEYVYVYKTKKDSEIFSNTGPFEDYKFSEKVIFSQKHYISLKTPKSSIPEKEILLEKFQNIKDFVIDSNGNPYKENIEEMINILNQIKEKQ